MDRPALDLRSDTVTKPTAPMRAAMAEAAVGDDAYGDDPTVRSLEARVSNLLEKDAAVFLPSGTMANQIAVRLHTRPGQCVAAPPGVHVQIHEDGSAAGLSGAQIMPIGSLAGFTPEDLQNLLYEEACGWPPVGLVWLENTLGLAGGKVWPIDQLEAIAAVARPHGRAVHLDGARLWNAHVTSGVPLPRLAATARTVSVAVSKGLGAPMGSLLCGPAPLIQQARTFKHAFGGGFRQAGILAAAGLYALDHHLDGLREDHRRARTLAQGLSDLPCWTIAPPETNIVLAEVRPPWKAAEELCRPLREAGILCYPNVHRQVRFVTHLGLDDSDIQAAIERVRAVLGPRSS